ncbi:sugar porter family MFS transporter [Actinomadura harenae]|uniref:Sugar porter family MFS transporter n=1 Tax=Actinomadura harenae TaxID=2483351 RepID=A0A3M2MGM5_9ACTN|nr:sugar porter family MFS transporter [Actinomadura harenae]RMI46398.1 sugar porter family MFS transporter [Actinomadura harenae]
MTAGFASAPVTHGPELDRLPLHTRRRLVFWTFCAALGGWLFGYDTGVVSGAMLFIRHEFGLGPAMQGAVVSVLLLSAAITAPVAGRLADRIGRRRALLLVAAVFVVGLVVAALAPNVGVLLLARFILGFGVGGASALVPVYLSELAPTRVRGTMVSTNQLMVTLGLLSSYIVDLLLSGTQNWRGMFAFGIVGAVLMLAGMSVAPETPAWLERHGHDERARSVISGYTPPDRIDSVVKGFGSAREESGRTLSVRELFASPAIRPALMIGLTLAALQQFCGINTIMYYAPTIMQKTGLNASNALVYSIIIGAINVLVTLVAMRLTDTVGRRRLLIVSVSLMALATVPMGLAFTTLQGTASSVTALTSTLAYIMAFAVGLGPVFWLLNAEIYPPSARAEAAGLATMVNWLSNFVVSQAFLPLSDAVGQGPAFWVFGVICVIALAYIVARVPETKNRTFQQIDSEIRGMHRPEERVPESA